jgi:glycosyltransferase involved in cell wall biosynthesis
MEYKPIKNKPPVSIIIPIKDNKYIENLKRDLKKQTFRKFETIILDSNEPVSVKRNKGVKKARGEWVVFIDDDVRLHPKWLEELLKNAKKDKVVMGTVMTNWDFGMKKDGQTCNCIFHKSKFIPFDESFKKAAFEDKDWFYRIGGVEIVPSAVIYHMDQQRHSIKKNFLFGVEDVKMWKKYRGKEWDHSIKHSIYYNIRDSLVYLSRIFGIIWGLVKYDILKRNS